MFKLPFALAPQKRLLSLDVLRGLTIAFMIMVNNSGGRARGRRCTTPRGTD